MKWLGDLPMDGLFSASPAFCHILPGHVGQGPGDFSLIADPPHRRRRVSGARIMDLAQHEGGCAGTAPNFFQAFLLKYGR